MTDGIIQEVFRPYLVRMLRIDKSDVFLIQQELIEKIKQLFPNDLDYEENNQYYREELIGDNK